MLGILPADIDQPTHTWAEADVSVSIWSLAMQNKLSAGSKGFLQFEDLFSERLVISRCGSLQSATCDALDRFADAAVLRAVADQRRLKVQVVATLSGTAFCLTSVNGVTEGAVIDASLVNYKGTPLTLKGGLESMLRKIMTEGGGDFLKSGIMGLIPEALANATAFGGGLRAVADGASPLSPPFGATLVSAFFRCGPQERWAEHLVECWVNVMAELEIIQQGFRPPKLVHGLAGVARYVAREAYHSGLRCKDFGLKEESYCLSNVGKLLQTKIDGSITARRAVPCVLARKARSLATEQVQLLVRQAPGESTIKRTRASVRTA